MPTYYDEFDQPMMHQIQYSRSLPPMPAGYDAGPHEGFRMDQVVDPLNASGPAAAVTGENKRSSIKEYLADIKARQKAGENVVPTFSNVTGTQVGQNVAGYMEEDPQSQFYGQQYQPSPVHNLDEYQVGPEGAPGIRQPMEGRNLMPGENYADVMQTPGGRSDAKPKKKVGADVDSFVMNRLEELAPDVAAAAGYRPGMGEDSPEYQRFMKAMMIAQKDARVAYYRELDKAMDLLKTGEFEGVQEYIAGGFKDPSVLKKVINTPELLIKAFQKAQQNYPGDDTQAMEVAVNQINLLKEYLKKGTLDNALKESGGAIDETAGMPEGPGRGLTADPNQRPEMIGGSPSMRAAYAADGMQAADGIQAGDRPTPTGQMGATPERQEQMKYRAQELMRQMAARGMSREEVIASVKQQLAQEYPDMKGYY